MSATPKTSLIREKAEIIDAEGLRRIITRIAHEIVERNKGTQDLVLVGVRRRGVPLAQRIAAKIKEFEGGEVPQGSLEPYVFYRRDGNLTGEGGVLGSLHQTTIGARFAGKMPARLDYNVEMVMQRGSLSTNDVSAWAGHWQLRESLAGKGAVKLTGEFNYASGDENPADGTRGTFDQLYPTPHDKYGLADQIGWKNIQHVRAGFEVTPFKGFPITTNYHSYWLANRNDALYNVASAVVAPRIPGGAASRFVGQEIDVQVSKTLFPQLQLAGGYAHMFTGAFLKESTPGASFSYPYVMATYVFLADK